MLDSNPSLLPQDAAQHILNTFSSWRDFLSRQGSVLDADPLRIDFVQGRVKDTAELPTRPQNTWNNVTLSCAAPERTGYLALQKMGEATEIYSFAACCYVFLTGRYPVTLSQDKRILVRNILSEQPADISSEHSREFFSLNLVIQKCLRKNPLERYQSINGFYADLLQAFRAPFEIFPLGRSDESRELLPNPPPVGRREELKRLHRHLQLSEVTHIQMAFIGAPSGMGKSYLLQTFSKEAFTEHGFVTFSSKCSELEKNVPYGAYEVMLQEVSKDYKKNSSFTAMESAQNVEKFVATLAQRLVQATQWVKHSRSEIRGVILCFDDLQWADTGSLDVLRYLSQGHDLGHTTSHPLPLLILGTFRSHEVQTDHPLHLRLLAAQPPECIEWLGPLSATETAHLVSGLLGEQTSAVQALGQVCYQICQGVPFSASEFVRACLRARAFYLASDAGTGEWAFDESKAKGVFLGQAVEGWVTARMNALAPSAHMLCLALAVMASHLSLDAARLLFTIVLRWFDHRSNQDDPFLHALQICIREGLVVHNQADKLLWFVHDKVHEAARILLPTELKKELCAMLAQYQEQVAHAQGSPLSLDAFESAQYVIEAEGACDPLFARRVLFNAAQKAWECFAYLQTKQYLEYASKTYKAPFPKLDALEQEHWLDIHALLAECRCVTAEVEQGLELFEDVLFHTKDQLKRAKLHAKRCKYFLALFRYSAAMEAGYQGLKDLNISYLRYNKQAILALILYFPVLLFTLARYLLRAPQIKEPKDEKDLVALELLVSIQVSAYYLRPLVACVNQLYIKLMREQFFYKPSLWRTMIVGYWGIVASSVGWGSLARYFYRDALTYLRDHPNPEAEGFIWFCWGYVLDFHEGLEEEAQEKCERSLSLLQSVGENFFRVNNLQCLVHIDYFGADSGLAAAASRQLLEFWKVVPFVPSFLAVTVRAPLLQGQEHEAQRRLELSKQALHQLKTWDAETIDYTYVLVAMGEFYSYRGYHKEALEPLRELMKVLFTRLHRIAYSNWGLILYARCLMATNSYTKAFIPMAFSWINVLLGIRVFLPQLCVCTGEWLGRFLPHLMCRMWFRWGIRHAEKKGWQMVLAECRLAYAKYLKNHNPEHALGLLALALPYFRGREQNLLVQSSVHLQAQINNILRQKIKQFKSSGTHTPSQTVAEDTGNLKSVRSEIERETLLSLVLRFSEMTAVDQLVSSTKDALRDVSGAHEALVFRMVTEQVNDTLGIEPVPRSAQNPPGFWSHGLVLSTVGKLLQSSLNQTSSNMGLNSENWCLTDEFLLEKFSEDLNLKKELNIPLRLGSALFLPLVVRNTLWGFCYLGHPLYKNFFDTHSQDLLKAIIKQAAVRLTALTDVQIAHDRARMDAEIEAAKAMQEALLPSVTEVPNLDMRTFYQSASVTGGDWFTYHFDPASKRVFFCIADVTGHGFSSALVTAVVCGAVHSSEHLNQLPYDEIQKRRGTGMPHANVPLTPKEQLLHIAHSANKAVLKASFRSKKLATVGLLSLDTETGELLYLNAGHTPPIWFRKNKAATKLLMNSGMRLGFSEELKVEVQSVFLEPGDGLFLYTDGLVENIGPQGDVFSLKELRSILATHAPVAQKQDEILHKARNTWQDAPAEDDVTFLIAQWQPGAQLLC